MAEKTNFGLRELYKYYKSKFTKDEIKSDTFIEYKTFSSIIKDFNKIMTKNIIEDGIEFKMPGRLGTTRVKKYKKRIRFNEDGSIDRTKLSVDWARTKAHWAELYPGKTASELKQIKNKELFYHLNDHTDGYNFIFYWNKKGSNVKNRSLYSMFYTSVNYRLLAHVLKHNPKAEYYE